jgi:hypothetical protein
VKNPLSLKVESWFGSIIILSISAFLVGFFLVAVRNFSSDAETVDFSTLKLKTVSPEEKLLIDQWLRQNNGETSSKETNYRRIIQQFPDKPWLNR